jgi:membrane protein required for colicin V production
MNIVDAAFLLLFFLSVTLGLLRGLVAEVLSLIALAINIGIANHYAGNLAPWVSQHVALPGLQYALAFAMLYGFMWLITSTIAYFFGSIVSALGLGWLDHLLGTLFGGLRGIIIILVIVLIVGLTPLPKETIWQDAMFTATAEHIIEGLRPMLSETLQKHVDFRPAAWIQKHIPQQQEAAPSPAATTTNSSPATTPTTTIISPNKDKPKSSAKKKSHPAHHNED